MEYLDFEKPIKKIILKINEIETLGEDSSIDVSKTLKDLKNQLTQKRKDIYAAPINQTIVCIVG